MEQVHTAMDYLPNHAIMITKKNKMNKVSQIHHQVKTNVNNPFAQIRCVINQLHMLTVTKITAFIDTKEKVKLKNHCSRKNQN